VYTLTKAPDAQLSYSFNGTQSTTGWLLYCSAAYAASVAPGACTPATGPVWINVTNAADGALLVLDETHFIWNNEPLPQQQGDYRSGQKGSIVELFGWPYGDIQEECALLASYGYLGFKVREGRSNLAVTRRDFYALFQMWSPIETLLSVNTIQNLLK